MVAGDNQHKVGAANLPDHGVSQSKAAEMLNVSERSVRSAAKVLHSGDDELVHAVERGEVAVSAADWKRVFTYQNGRPPSWFRFTIATSNHRERGRK